MNKGISETMLLVGELAHKLKVSSIKDLPGPWIHSVDDKWIIAVNGKQTRQEVIPQGTMGATIEPYHMAVWCNGWLAGIISPAGGWFASGDAANEDNFISLLKEKIAQ